MTTKYNPYMQKLGFVGVLLEVLPKLLLSAGHTC